jgi:hypothetical protein
MKRHVQKKKKNRNFKVKLEQYKKEVNNRQGHQSAIDSSNKTK